MTKEQLLSHAARCIRLAELCSDPVVARKLRALANDYQHFARRRPELPLVRSDENPQLVPPHGATDEAA